MSSDTVATPVTCCYPECTPAGALPLDSRYRIYGLTFSRPPRPCYLQGPPGTGKTHTVVGILNSWHMIQYRRHQAAWLDAARTALAVSARRGGLGADAALLELTLPRAAAPPPRILVCAPSNAATDELLERILVNGFIDPQVRELLEVHMMTCVLHIHTSACRYLAPP